MAWIESHQSLAYHRKMIALRADLGISKPEAIGYMHLLWWWAMDNARDGRLTGILPVVIADVVEWRGDAARFLEALVRSGFLDRDGDELTIHNWTARLGRLHSQREAKRRRDRMAKAAIAAKAKEDSPEIRPTVAPRRDTDSQESLPLVSPQPSPLPSPPQTPPLPVPSSVPPLEPPLYALAPRSPHDVARPCNEMPTELPPGFPRTEKEAIAAAMTTGCTPEFILATWNNAVARGGADWKGIPIRSWAHHVSAAMSYGKSRAAEAPKNGFSGPTSPSKPTGADKMLLLKRLEQVDAELKSIVDQTSHDAFGPMFSKDDKKRRGVLLDEKVALTEKVKAMTQ